MNKVIVTLLIIMAAICAWAVVDNSQRTEACHKQQGQMINTPRGTLCVLNLVTTNIPKN